MRVPRRMIACLALLSGSLVSAFAAPPFITSLSPSAAAAGSPGVFLTINGINFAAGARVLWSGIFLTPNIVNSVRLDVAVSAGLLAVPQTVYVSVLNPDGLASQAVPFTVSSSLAIQTTSLPAGTVGVAYLATLTTSGGTAPYAWSAEDGLPPGLTLTPDGRLTGTPGSAGTFSITVRVTDSSQIVARSVLPLSIATPALAIATGSPLATGTVGSPYTTTLTTTGGIAPYRWTATGSLPDGITLNSSTGVFGGTPQTRGSYNFTVQVTDSAGTSASKTFSLAINPAPLAITTSAPLFIGTVGSFYSQPFHVSGGAAPYTWAISSGQIPTGLSFDASLGALTGTPGTADTFTFSVRVSDAIGGTASKTFSLTVDRPKLSILTLSLPAATAGTSYQQQQPFSASGGTPPYTWLLASGSVPGLAFEAGDAALAGIPLSAGSFTLTVQVRDAAGHTALRSFTLTVNPQPLTITTATQLPAAALAVPYTQAIAAAGGVPPYTWSANGMPQGLQIDASTGVITGSPAAAGQLLLTIRVTDNARSSATGLFRITISLPPLPDLSITGLAATSDAADQKSLTVSLASPYAVAVSGQLILSFASDVGAGDSTIQFSNGGRSIDFTIEPGTTEAAFPVSSLAVQTGTVAGTISVTAQIQAAGLDATPSPAPVLTTRINRAAPVIKSAKLVRNANGFGIQITGFATSREITQAIFRFKVAGGSTLQQSQITVPLDTLFGTWYQDSGSSRFGSQFVLTQPFTVQGGDANAITPESVVLANRTGETTAPVN